MVFSSKFSLLSSLNLWISIPLALRALALVACLGFSVTAFSQANPFDSDPAAVRAGNALFDAKCAVCHGANAKGLGGIDAPDLTELWALGRSDEQIFTSIEEGVAGSVMPPHPAPAAQTWAIVAYLKTLGINSADEFTRGNKEVGRTLFQSHCASCHRVKDGNQLVGGRLGPNLSNITARRSRDALLQSLRDPSAMVARGYQLLEATTNTGETLRGVIKSQDAFSLQVMTEDESLRGLQRDNLQRLSIGEMSLMPAFDAEQFDENAADDLFFYLDNL